MLIEIKGLLVSASVGILEWEKAARRPILIDLTIDYDHGPAAATDDVADTLDYTAVERQTAEIAAGRHFNLLETLVEHIARGLFLFPQVMAATVSITKTDVMELAESVTVRESYTR